MITAYQVAARPTYKREKPLRNPDYRAFISRQGSVVSGFGPCDPCHTGPHGKHQKSSDYSCIPLTRREHQRFDADPEGFARYHKLDIQNLVEQFNAMYFGRKAA